FSARVFWLGKRPLASGRPYRFKLVTQEFEGEIVGIEQVVDASTLQASESADGTSIPPDAVGDVRIRTRTPVVVDTYERVPTTGRFVIVDENEVCGGGIVTTVVDEVAVMTPTSANLVRTIGQVSRNERSARNGHR